MPVAGVVLGSGLSDAVQAVRDAARDDGVEIAVRGPARVPAADGRRPRGTAVDRAGRRPGARGLPGPDPLLRGPRALAVLAPRRGFARSSAPGRWCSRPRPAALDPAIAAGLDRRGPRPPEPHGRRTRSPAGGTRTARPRSSTCPASTMPDLADAARASASAHAGEEVREGVYVALSGSVLRDARGDADASALGGTVVGMSTVPEAVAARALGMRVLGLRSRRTRAGVERLARGGARGVEGAPPGTIGAGDRGAAGPMLSSERRRRKDG